MKILQVNTVCKSGSVGRIALDLYSIIEANGDECVIAYGRGAAPEGIRTIHVNTRMDFYSHAAYSLLTGAHGLASSGATQRLIEKIEEYNPDIIHLHNIHGFYMNIKIFFDYLKKADKPVIWTLHDCWSFTGHCAYFDYAECGKWKDGCNRCIQYRNSYPYGVFHDNSVNNYNIKKEVFTSVKNLTIVTPSRWLKDYVKKSFLKEYETRVIYNGIDLSKFKPFTGGIEDKYNKDNKKIILGAANMWEARKGLTYFEQLSEILTDDYRIILVGLNRAQLKKLNPKITGIERTESVFELAKLYSLADVYVNATLEDNFPTTNIEALACDTPVITFATGGSVESIDDSCGIIVAKKDVEGLKRAVMDICENKGKYNGCLAKSRQFDKNDRFKEYIDLYESVYERSKLQ